MIVTDPVYDDFFCSDVHKIVRDTFASSIAVINPVITWVYRIIELPVSGIFMNNWAILFLASSFMERYKRRILLARQRVMNLICCWVVHKMLISRLTFVNSSDMRIVL